VNETPPVPHRCRRGDRCPGRERLDDGQILGALIPAADGLCPHCERAIGTAIGELPRDYVDLQLLLAAGGSTGGPLVSGTRELPIPIRVSVEAVQAAIVHEVCCWAESVAEVMRITWDTQDLQRCRPGWRVQRGSRLLAGAVSALLALRDVVHIGWETGVAAAEERDGITGALVLLELHHQTRRVAGRGRLVHRLPAPCPRCQCTALERPDGDDIITCQSCERRYSWDEYHRLCNALAYSREAA
jgi:hypothetical protein